MAKKLCLLFILSFLTACSLTRRAPEVSLVNLGVGEVTLFQTQMTVRLLFENDNNDDLAISGGVHRLYINDTYVGKGRSDQELRIPRLGSAEQTIPIRIDNLSMFANFQSMIDAPRFEYRIESVLYPLSGFGSYSTSKEGVFELFNQDRGKSGGFNRRLAPAPSRP